jgi:hypothetical protein
MRNDVDRNDAVGITNEKEIFHEGIIAKHVAAGKSIAPSDPQDAA